MPKRVLFVSPVGEKGGAETVLLDIVRGLDRARFTPLVACLKPGPLVDELRALDVPTLTLRAHKTRHLHRVGQAVVGLARIIRRERIDLVHGNGCTMLFYAGFAARLAGGPPCLWHVYDPLRGSGAFERAFVAAQRRLSPACTIFGTPAVAESYLAAYPNVTRHRIILPGVAAEVLGGAEAARARRRLDIAPDAPLVAMFARLQRNKGHLDLLEAASGVLAARPDSHFVVCGGALFGLEPDYPALLEGEIQKRGLCGRVTLAGYVSDAEKRDILAAADVVVHPALPEPFGLAVLEGMAAGKPVVATDCVGPATIVRHGETGLLTPRGDAAALAAALLAVLNDPARAARMGDAGRRRVETHYTASAMVRQVEEVYAQVLEGVSQ